MLVKLNHRTKHNIFDYLWTSTNLSVDQTALLELSKSDTFIKNSVTPILFPNATTYLHIPHEIWVDFSKVLSESCTHKTIQNGVDSNPDESKTYR